MAKLGALDTSAIGFGCMGVTAFYGPAMENNAANDLLAAVHKMGYTHFDTAEIYRSGNPFEPNAETIYNEKVVGEYLRTQPRDSYTVATKFFPMLWGSKCDLATVTAAVDASLARLGLDCIDLYYCHRMPTELEALEEFMRSMKEIVASGKVKHVGLSEVSPEWLRKACAIHPVAAVQQEWSLLTRNLEESVVPTCKELGVGIVAYSPLARNLLCDVESPPETDWRVNSCPRYSEENFKKNKELAGKITEMGKSKDKSSAQLSLAWLYHQAKKLGVTVVPIPGTTKVKNAEANIGALEVTLSDEELQQLTDIGATVAGLRGNEQYLSMGIEKWA
eukprot:TRINITY_DN75385_c0_g1_i1.p1 TRINITY_DN75385_c0_g1~~TRINITY_DN75385_c0_g1_i1.p1  ORF type:complete len:334 (+),score=99.58 TRINITY_DN75385_c0_g1_i1:78-1079(+)